MRIGLVINFCTQNQKSLDLDTMNTPIKPNTIADHLLIPINSFKKNFAKIDTKNGHEKNKAFAVANGI